MTEDLTGWSANVEGVFDESVGFNNTFLVDKDVESGSTEHSSCGLAKALDVCFVSSSEKGDIVVLSSEFKGEMVLLDIGIVTSPYFIAISD